MSNYIIGYLLVLGGFCIGVFTASVMYQAPLRDDDDNNMGDEAGISESTVEFPIIQTDEHIDILKVKSHE